MSYRGATPRGGGQDPGGRGRGGRGGRGRGRGRGGPLVTVDFTSQRLDYNNLTQESFGFSPTPAPAFAYVPTPPHSYPVTSAENSPAPSGYNTPKRGLAYNANSTNGDRSARGRGARGADVQMGMQRGGRGQRGNPGNRGAGSPAGRGTPGFATRGGARGGRGGAGGLGFHNSPLVEQTYGAGFGFGFGGRGGGRGGRGGGGGGGDYAAGPRPLLVPVAFVKASAPPPGLGGDEEEEVLVLPAREKVETMQQGNEQQMDEAVDPDFLANVEDLTIATTTQEQDESEDDGDDDDVLEITSVHLARPQPLFAVDTVPSTPQVIIAQSLQIPSGFILGLTPSPAIESPADSDEDETILFPTVNPDSTLPIDPAPLPLPLPSSTSPPPVPTSTSVSFPPLQSAPTKPKSTKLTPSQKRQLKAAGKKARKNGTKHARSGNQHLFQPAPLDDEDSSDNSGDDDDLQAGEDLLDQILGANDVEVEQVEGEDGRGSPRRGDSDLDWGDGEEPPVRDPRGPHGGDEGNGKNRKSRRREERAERRETERMERLSIGARGEVALALGVGLESLVKPLHIEVGNGGSARRGRNSHLDEAARDYAQNIIDSRESGEEEDDLTFLKSLTGTQKTIDEMDDEARARAEDEDDAMAGWRTTDESESGNDDIDEDAETDSEVADSDDELEMDYALGQADAEVDRALAEAEDAFMSDDDELDSPSSSNSSDENEAIERALLQGKKVRIASMGTSGPGGRRDKKEKKRAKKGKGKMESSSEEEDSDEDDDAMMFEGNSTWADNDEDYIRGLQEIIDLNADLLDGNDRKSRKKLFKAVQEGDFRGYDFDDDIVLSARSSKAKPSSSSGNFASELQAQWEQDRSKKGEFKKARALARAARVEASPHLHKKGPKPPHSNSSNPSDIVTINYQIREFLLHEVGKQTLSLPPMSKKSRVAVHLLSEVYGLKSKSIGKGKHRFPVLERTSKSGVFGVDERRVQAIIGTAAGERSSYRAPGFAAKGKMGGLWAALDGNTKSKGAGGAQRSGKANRDGGVVGEGAPELDEKNIGYALLKKMGWTEGGQIGVSGGLSKPIDARIKTSKSGLGSFTPWA